MLGDRLLTLTRRWRHLIHPLRDFVYPSRGMKASFLHRASRLRVTLSNEEKNSGQDLPRARAKSTHGGGGRRHGFGNSSSNMGQDNGPGNRNKQNVRYRVSGGSVISGVGDAVGLSRIK